MLELGKLNNEEEVENINMTTIDNLKHLNDDSLY